MPFWSLETKFACNLFTAEIFVANFGRFVFQQCFFCVCVFRFIIQLPSAWKDWVRWGLKIAEFFVWRFHGLCNCWIAGVYLTRLKNFFGLFLNIFVANPSKGFTFKNAGFTKNRMKTEIGVTTAKWNNELLFQQQQMFFFCQL